MTTYETLSLVVSLGGFTAVVLTLSIFLRQTRAMAEQARLLAESARRDSFDRVAAQAFLLDQLFLDYPEVRPYFYEGKLLSDEDPVLRHRIAAAAETVLDVFGVIVLHRERFAEVWSSNTWDEYMRHVFARSPFLCSYLRDVHKWFPPDLVRIADEANPNSGTK
jgi:hypothetical protein